MGKTPRSASAICALLMMCSATTASAGDAGTLPDPPDWREAVLELRLNGVVARPDIVIALRDAAGGLWLAESDFARLRLGVPQVPPHVADHKRYFPVAAIPGARVAFDEVHSA